MDTILRASIFTGLLVTISACSDGSSGVDISVEEPDYFLGRVDEVTMQGAYNPAGFSAAQVRKLVSETCEQGKLTGFGTQDRTDGLTSFVASCETWKHNARRVEYERIDGAEVIIEILGSFSGSVTFDQIYTTV